MSADRPENNYERLDAQAAGTPTVADALEDYRHRCEIAPLNSYPVVWGAHYNSRLCLGQFGVPKVPKNALAPICGAVMIPFAISAKVEVSYVVVDTMRVPDTELLFETSRVLYVASLRVVQPGVLTTFWTVPFAEIRDIGNLYGEPEKSPALIPRIGPVLSELVDRRLRGPNASYEDAYAACLIVFDELFR